MTDHVTAAAPVLTVRNLSKTFGGVRAINDISFAAADHRVTALIGPNGAGKTTVFNLITNIFSRDAGDIVFAGRSIAGRSSVAIAEMGLIRTFQSARVFPGMTALENVMTGRHRHATHHGLSQMLWLPGARREEREARTRAEEMLDLAGLAPFRDAHAAELPMGAQKLLEVIRALMARPKLLCLDEPAAGLNDTETHELAALLRAIRSTGIPVLIVEHNMSLVMNVADHIVVLDAGTIIAAGRPETIQADAGVIEAYLGREADAAARA
jgi:branched-chain amino acid transport system ATP-binding protein